MQMSGSMLNRISEMKKNSMANNEIKIHKYDEIEVMHWR